MEEDLLTIINHYGIGNQLKYIHSEYYELDEAILKELEIAFNSEGDFGDKEALRKAKKHITEEIADVMVMLKQFQYYYDIEEEHMEKIMREKIKRQLERIEKDK